MDPPWEAAVSQHGTTPEGIYKVIVVCPDPRHEYTMAVSPADGAGPAQQACEAVFVLLNIGRAGVDDLAELGYSPEQVEAVRAWYAHHGDLPPGTKLEVIAPDGTVRHLACDAFAYARPYDNPVSPAPNKC